MPTFRAEAPTVSPEERHGGQYGFPVAKPGNPLESQRMLHTMLKSDTFHLHVKMPGSERAMDTVWTQNGNAAREILRNDSGIWRKGPTTFRPFTSLVEKHLIALEGEEHGMMRKAAVEALGGAIASGRVGRIAGGVAKELVDVLKGVATGNTESWIASKSKENAVSTCVDRMFRAAALDIITGMVFDDSWGAVKDYSPQNVKADALARVMYELHYRVSINSSREWETDPRTAGAGELLDILNNYIEQNIDASINRVKSLPAGQPVSDDACMLDQWTSRFLIPGGSGTSPSNNLTRTHVRNLCLVFLTMGHENVATGLAHTLILLAENHTELEHVYAAHAQGNEKEFQARLRTALEEAVRLYPSVAALTRMPLVDVEIDGYLVPAYTELMVSLYGLQRDPKVWGKDADEFKPKSRCPVTTTEGYPDSTPFGVGARSCIGRPLTMAELEHVVGALIKSFDLKSLKAEPAKAYSLVSLRPGPHEIAFVVRREAVVGEGAGKL